MAPQDQRAMGRCNLESKHLSGGTIETTGPRLHFEIPLSLNCLQKKARKTGSRYQELAKHRHKEPGAPSRAFGDRGWMLKNTVGHIIYPGVFHRSSAFAGWVKACQHTPPIPAHLLMSPTFFHRALQLRQGEIRGHARIVKFIGQ